MTDSPYLSKREIEDLTGRVYRSAQVKVLTANGWKFEFDGDGNPKILRAYHDRRMGLATTPAVRGPRLEGLASR